jgi:hypothetical protein
MRSRRLAPPLAALLALVAGVAQAPPAAAQLGHGTATGPRPLHLRLAAADVVAIATIEDVRDDRVALRDARVLRGDAPPQFELKRAPSKGIPYAVGLTVLLPLRGARSPYVLVDDARELVVLRDEAARAAWSDGVQALLAAGDDREALLDVYLAWLAGADEPLREAAGAALVDPRAQLVPVSADRAVERARAALGPALPAPARRVSAILAAGRPEGAAALVPGLADPGADPQVLETALRGAVRWRLPALDDALLAGLAHANPAVRRAAVKAIETAGSPPGLARLPEVARQDADEGVRREAEKVVSARR